MQILKKITQWISEGSGWTIESVDNHYINIVKYEPRKANHILNYHKKFKIVQKDK